jgi:GNAT superfamily N-acetyltransferase
MKIVHTLNPAANQLEYLTEQINKEALEMGITDQAFPFAFYIYEQEQLIAGCNGSLIYGSIYTDQLWVHPHYRKKGLGKALMEKVHELGKAHHCTLATVSTLSFQNSRSFYEKLGYTVDFCRPGYVQESVCFFMRKDLESLS